MGIVRWNATTRLATLMDLIAANVLLVVFQESWLMKFVIQNVIQNHATMTMVHVLVLSARQDV
jgi:hypothetical protein